ncbi:hypothetical protein [Xanthobacter versatilis]|uniref:hypothetical protein n=1 Tax=Xanthobacter autotrophicus (strain ATCC BAA-1158 / Py2) TaxID=78245 RepID=UPI00372B8932
MVPSQAALMVIREASLGEERHTELMGLQSELSGAALKAAMETDAAGIDPATEAGPRRARRAVRLNPLAWMAVSFLAGVVVGALLRPVTIVRTGRNAG